MAKTIYEEILYVCVCVVYACFYVFVPVCVHVCRGPRLALDVFFDHSSRYLLRQDLSVKPRVH